MIISYPDHYYPTETFEHRTHEVTIVWTPTGERDEEGKLTGDCSYQVDGQEVLNTPYAFLQPELTLWQGTNSVNSGGAEDGTTSYAEHGPVTVTYGAPP